MLYSLRYLAALLALVSVSVPASWAATRAATRAATQFTGGDREVLPFDVFRGRASAVSPFGWDVGQVEKEGDLVVVHSREVDPASGNQGALYIHRRTAAGWQVEAILDSTSVGATTQIPYNYFGQEFALSGSTIFVPYRLENVSGQVFSIAVIERVGASWSLVQTLTPDPSYGKDQGRDSFIAADGSRLVIGSPGVPFGPPQGTLETFVRGAAGFWTLERTDEVTRFPGLANAVPHLVGDRLAVSDAVFDYGGPTVGWQLLRRVSFAGLPGGGLYNYAATVALDGPRLIIGYVNQAPTAVFDLSQPASMPPVQVLPYDETLTRDYNPPYDALVAAEDGYLVVGVGDVLAGECTVRHLEWYQGTYRVFDTERTGLYVGGVDMGAGESVFIAAPGDLPLTGTVAPARFEVRELEAARAVPFCDGDATMLVSGSGAAPFNGATLRGYELPANSTSLVLASLGDGLFPVGTADLCLGGSPQGPFRASFPLPTTSAGTFTAASSLLRLDPIAATLLPGGSFTLQTVFRDGLTLKATNALRVTLGD